MPKSNFCQPKTDERLDFLREAVDGGMSRNNIKTKELSLKTGINKSTLYKRRKKPETMTIGEASKSLWRTGDRICSSLYR